MKKLEAEMAERDEEEKRAAKELAERDMRVASAAQKVQEAKEMQEDTKQIAALQARLQQPRAQKLQ
ncbi:MAG TPA: hypothetical protein DD491_09705, partial [Halieaceae bacterium]|nr:hypothetical protein [Halieaceae bacterium]